ncbi:MAG: hypothetical protein RLY86_3474 [Pseudomonadota bacterium]|jgi:hypothetical protein
MSWTAGVASRPLTRTALAAQAGLVFALALALRLFGLEAAPIHFDEYYHLLAAESWQETGTLAILSGEYRRTPHYTQLVGLAQQALGGGIWAARLPSALAGAATVAVLFLWVRLALAMEGRVVRVPGGTTASGYPASGHPSLGHPTSGHPTSGQSAPGHPGRTEAWLAALAAAVLPELVELSQMVRFYALHGLLILLAAIPAWSLGLRLGSPGAAWADRTVGSRGGAGLRAIVGLALLCGILLLGALTLQSTTLIAGLAVAAGVLALIVTDHGWQLPTGRTRWLLIGGVLLGLGGVATLAAEGRLDGIWAAYRETALWNAANRDHVTYYHWYMKDTLGALWILFPAAVIVAIARAPRFALFCTVVFGVILVLHSFAGMKNGRYIAYGLPFFAILWAIALPAAGAWLWDRARLAVGGMGIGRWSGGRDGTGTRAGLLTGVIAGGMVAVAGLALTVDASKAWRETGRVGHAFLPTPYRISLWEGHAGWRAAAALVGDRVAEGAVVITAHEFNALAYLGRVDVVVSASRLHEGRPAVDFTPDRRTGLPVIGSLPAFQQVLDCAVSGVAVFDDEHFPSPHAVTAEMAALLLSRGTRLTPADSAVQVITWQNQAPPPCPYARGSD